MARFVVSGLLLSLVVGLSGCSGFIYRQTGDTLGGFAKAHMVPWLMANEDIGLACRTGGAVGPLVRSFERVDVHTELPSMVSWLGAGMCAEASAWESELTNLRAIKAGQASVAKDAALLEERHHRVAAMRFGVAWNLAVAKFPGIGSDKCPEIAADEEVYFLLGTAAGLLSVLHDRASGGAANIDTRVLPMAARAAKCLDSAKWWGVPAALQASVWMSVPGSAPKGTDIAKRFSEAAAQGDKAGVRLARALQVLALEGAGDIKGMAAAVLAHQTSITKTPSAKSWRLLDTYGRNMTQQAVDRTWTREKGHRGPTGALALPEKAPAPGEDDDMLGGLDGDG